MYIFVLWLVYAATGERDALFADVRLAYIYVYIKEKIRINVTHTSTIIIITMTTSKNIKQ